MRGFEGSLGRFKTSYRLDVSRQHLLDVLRRMIDVLKSIDLLRHPLDALRRHLVIRTTPDFRDCGGLDLATLDILSLTKSALRAS